MDTVENGVLVSEFLKGKKLVPIVLSHGFEAALTYYSGLCRELASYGYIIFSVGHQDGSGILTT